MKASLLSRKHLWKGQYAYSHERVCVQDDSQFRGDVPDVPNSVVMSQLTPSSALMTQMTPSSFVMCQTTPSSVVMSQLTPSSVGDVPDDSQFHGDVHFRDPRDSHLRCQFPREFYLYHCENPGDSPVYTNVPEKSLCPVPRGLFSHLRNGKGSRETNSIQKLKN